MSVEPGGLLIQHIKPGERYNLAAIGGIQLKIVNQSADERRYRISVGTPEKLGISQWTEGYTEIHEPGWFSVEPVEMR
jgi:hypothetical protein